METLAQSQGPEALANKAFQLYEAFRPEIPPNEAGWGAKGKLSLKKIQELGQLKWTQLAGHAGIRLRLQGRKAVGRDRLAIRALATPTRVDCNLG